MEGGRSSKLRRGLFFFFFFFFFAFYFSKRDENLFWVYQNGNFLPGKGFHAGKKKSGKMTLPPQKKIKSCYAPARQRYK